MKFDSVDHIGSRIKEIRKKKSMTIQKLAQYTDLSVGYLSNLERNQASPTLANLQKICIALEVSINDVLSEREEDKFIIRWDEQTVWDYEEFRQQVRRMDFGNDRGVYEYITVEPGESELLSTGLHPYPEVCVVLEGQLELTLGEEVYLLNEGDSIYVKAHTSHTMRNPGKTVCRTFWHLQLGES
ncbi:MAG: XRE family transcriptional regulator [Clostridiaceae bacterium]|nr:XRE family transcriptional regulator [Clostridiaceae bacterium]MDD6072987.1 XRE family transcriptional regulator [Clostridium sp.]